MFHFNMRPEFKARAAGWVESSTTAGKGVAGVLRNTVVGGIAGWGFAVVAGAVMMTHGAHEATAPSAPPPAPSIAAPKAPTPAPAIDTGPVAAITPVAPAPAPTPAKTTQRVDVTPTGAVAETAPKPKHKPHKKKPKDLDNAQ